MTQETIYLAGGCFWGIEKFFEQFDGIIETQVGYANGPSPDPTYQEVCRSSGHAETVKITFDMERITLPQILDYYFMTIDPVSVNRQGNDYGIQYRTGIYYTTKEQMYVAGQKLEALEKQVGKPLAVELLPLENFYLAEEYHQKYLNKNPGGYCHIPYGLLHLKQGGKEGLDG